MKTLITKTIWKGIELIDIRKYFNKDGELIPSKKGISLTPAHFESLLSEFQNTYDGSVERFKSSLPMVVEEKFLLSSKIDVEFNNGEIKTYLDPQIANISLKDSSEALLIAIQELCAEHDLDPKLTIQKLFKYL
tara:strand:- start:1732 stop:2133 length:402 start_codon:yes stop_codon:yes gene_type:complete